MTISTMQKKITKVTCQYLRRFDWKQKLKLRFYLASISSYLQNEPLSVEKLLNHDLASWLILHHREKIKIHYSIALPCVTTAYGITPPIADIKTIKRFLIFYISEIFKGNEDAIEAVADEIANGNSVITDNGYDTIIARYRVRQKKE